MAQSKKYFKEGSFFFKLLRFLNLLEPEYPILSLSKILVMMMMWLFIHVALYYPDNLPAIITAGFGITASLANYGYRRHIQTVKSRFMPHEPSNPFGGFRMEVGENEEGLEPDPED